MAKVMKVAVVGASGRMGRQVVALLHPDQKVASVAGELLLHAAITRANSSALGIDSGVLADGTANQVVITDNLAALNGADVVIDFALAEGLSERLQAYHRAQCPAVICVTGLTDGQQQELCSAAAKNAILHAANTSVGINLLAALTEKAAEVLGSAADIEIFEAHHTQKKDAPSGTALLLGESAARGRGQNLAEVAAYDRNGENEIHAAGSIGFATIRAGDIVGEHTVYLVLGGERIELTHRVANRSTFAEGALRAASWLANQQTAGFYTMKDALGLD